MNYTNQVLLYNMSIEYIVVCGRINYYHNRSSKVHILELNHVQLLPE